MVAVGFAAAVGGGVARGKGGGGGCSRELTVKKLPTLSTPQTRHEPPKETIIAQVLLLLRQTDGALHHICQIFSGDALVTITMQETKSFDRARLHCTKLILVN